MFHVVLHGSGPQWDPSLPLEEQSRWEEHAAFMDGLVDGGFIVLGGPLADAHRVVHAVEAASEEDVRATLALDRSVDDPPRRAPVGAGRTDRRRAFLSGRAPART